VGILLAGGRSTRFGANDKLAADYRGAPLLHHAVRGLAAACEEVIVVTSPAASAPSLPSDVPVRVVHDAAEGRGPLAGLSAGLASIAGDTLAVVAGGDMPDLRVDVLREMLRAVAPRRVEAVALEEGESFRPLPCVVRAAPALIAANAAMRGGRRSILDMLGRLAIVVIAERRWTELDPDRRTLLDVDEPGDLDL